jgi:methylase of polypeptide subunit release factors
MTSRDETEARDVFAQRYGVRSDAATEVERCVLGSDYGGNGYTTVDQADELANRLELTPADRLLDLGAGCGWPGLYLSRRTGCRVIVTDLPLEGMRRAQVRASTDGTASRARAVVSSARRLPFRPETFDAIIHTDVL